MKPLKEAVIKEQNVPFSVFFQDTYKSIYDPLQESREVFLKGIGSDKLWNAYKSSDIKKPVVAIAELGFGTGTNFIVTAHHFLNTSSSYQKLFYVAFEKYPLKRTHFLKYCPAFDSLSKQLKEHITNYYPPALLGQYIIPFHNHRITLMLYLGDIDYWYSRFSGKIDAWYLDGFSPKTCPKMWSSNVFHMMQTHSLYHAKVASFSVSSHVKHQLAQYGFIVKLQIHTKLKKKETLTAFYTKGSKRNLPPKIHIYGAGIAGLTLAKLLNEPIFNDNSIKNPASNIEFATLSPKYLNDSTGKAPFFSTAYYYSLAYYANYLKAIEHKGIIDTLLSKINRKRLTTFYHNDVLPKDDAIFCDKKYLEQLIKTSLPQNSSAPPKEFGIYYPKGMVINTSILRHMLRKTIPIYQKPWKDESSHNNSNIITILCLGKDIPSPYIKTNIGQTLCIPSSHLQTYPLHPLKGAGSVIPPIKGFLTLGGIYKNHNNAISKTSYLLIQKTSAMLPNMLQKIFIAKEWSAIRATTEQRFPLLYSKTISNSHTIWLYGALGSHGYQSAPLLSLYLYTVLYDLPSPLHPKTQSLLTPKLS